MSEKLIKARVYRSAKREFDCKIIESNEMVSALAYGNLLKKRESIVIGDFVYLKGPSSKSNESSSNQYNIVKVKKRKNEIFRMIVRERKKKVTAANCDLLAILTSVSKPEFKRGFLDRFLVRAFQWEIRPIVIFNKMDQYDPNGEWDIPFERDRLLDLGIKCFDISALNPTHKNSYLDLGFSDLQAELKNQTAIFVGQSGVGKSELISSLTGGKIDLKTQNVGKVGKGSHTTTWSEIIDCDSFTMIDSPGIRSFSLDDILEDQLVEYFPDIHQISTKCKFKNCTHAENAKGCAFRDPKVYEKNSYKTKLVLSRLESYLRMYDEVSEMAHWEKKF